MERYIVTFFVHFARFLLRFGWNALNQHGTYTSGWRSPTQP
jgi:hypothetical protein